MWRYNSKGYLLNLVVVIMMLVWLPTCEITVQINNIHNGYKYKIKGNPTPNPTIESYMNIEDTEILQNTLPEEQNINEIIETTNKLSIIHLQQLSQITELFADSQFTEVIVTNWLRKPQYSVTFLLGPSNQVANVKAFESIRDHSRPYSQQLL